MSIWTTRKLDRDREYIVMRHPLRGINNIINGVKFRDSYAVVEKGSKVYHYLKKIPVLRKAEEYPLTHLRYLHFVNRTSDVKMVYGEDVYSKFLKAEEDAKLAEELAIKQAQEEAALAEEQARLEQLRIKEELEAQIEAAKQHAEESEMGEIIEVVEETAKDLELPVENLTETLEEVKSEIKKCCVTTKNGTLCKFDALDYSPSGYCRLHLLEDPKLEHFGITIPKAMTKNERKKVRKQVNKKLQQLKKQGEF